MFVLGTLLEGGQHFSPGRAVKFGDVIANGVRRQLRYPPGPPDSRLHRNSVVIASAPAAARHSLLRGLTSP
jgi:hypothetical protein